MYHARESTGEMACKAVFRRLAPFWGFGPGSGPVWVGIAQNAILGPCGPFGWVFGPCGPFRANYGPVSLGRPS